MEKCKFESENGECLINECMYWPITDADKNKYNLCESVRKSLEETTTDCDDCKAKIRADVIEEFKDLGKLYSEIRAEVIDEILSNTKTIIDEDGIIHEVVLVKDIKKIEEKQNDQELELFVGDEKIGEAEIDIKNRMLSRLMIYPQFQNQGYGTEVIKILTEKYKLNVLWVNADNFRAIKCYEKNGYRITQNTMYKMEKQDV